MTPRPSEQEQRAQAVLAWLHELWPAAAEAHGLPSRASILAARTTIEVGRRLGVAYHAIPVDVAVLNARAAHLHDKLIPVEQWDPWACSVGAVCEDQVTGYEWPGHLVVASQALLSDLTAAAKFSIPERGITMPPWLLPRPDPGHTEWWWTLPGGVRLMLHPRTDVRGYRRTPDWTSRFRPLAAELIDQIVTRETAAQEQAAADETTDG